MEIPVLIEIFPYEIWTKNLIKLIPTPLINILVTLTFSVKRINRTFESKCPILKDETLLCAFEESHFVIQNTC